MSQERDDDRARDERARDGAAAGIGTGAGSGARDDAAMTVWRAPGVSSVAVSVHGGAAGYGGAAGRGGAAGHGYGAAAAAVGHGRRWLLWVAVPTALAAALAASIAGAARDDGAAASTTDSSSVSGASGSASVGGAAFARPGWGGTEAPGASGGGGAAQGGTGAQGGDGTSASGATSATAATDEQQGGVVTITSTLGYEDATSAGTGMVLTSGGLVLTNNHVIDGATSIEVTVESTGTTYAATVVGTAPSDDVALLQLTGASGLATITADEDGVAVGDAITAIGNAEGTGDLVAAAGTVTATDQTITASTSSYGDSETLDGLIELQADVVSGDSGGPVLDSDGEVVGITTAASTGGSSGISSGTSTTVAYAITIEHAIAIVHEIETGGGDGIALGYPAFLGVQVASTSSGASLGAADSTSGSASGGAVVGGVVAGTAAAKAGITAGDTITAVGGKAVDSSAELSSAIAGYAPGDAVKVTWVSGTSGETSSATVTLTAGPAD
ncbi:S1C family serine protease [Cellulomonas sp. HZM]|uniref:S1C family serine protease n=1 Tax=Cellulomonas sp. HZM TaxID=1454010 RepID=UPI00068B8AAC|nr:trypsin-like peptidase domain-containing protein [Cellulomonas sp. HZM]